MWPQIFAAATMNAFTSPSRQRPLLQCGHNFLANRVALLEGDFCIRMEGLKCRGLKKQGPPGRLLYYTYYCQKVCGFAFGVTDTGDATAAAATAAAITSATITVPTTTVPTANVLTTGSSASTTLGPTTSAATTATATTNLANATNTECF